MNQVNVQEAIDEAPMSRLQLYLLATCTGVMLVDGLDIYMLGKFAPAIAESFGEPVAAIATIFLFQQIGLTVGAFLISPLADRFGRKPVLMWSTFIFGILTLAAIWTQSVFQMAVIRGLTGLFLAAIIPNCVALLTEYAPKRSRSTFVTIAFTGFSMGGGVASLIVIFLLERYGWQSAFWIGGLLPLLLLPVINYCIPESLQYQARRNPTAESIGRILQRINPAIAYEKGTKFVSGDKGENPTKARLSDVFTGGMAPVTIILWLVYFVALANVALFANFAPTFFYQFGGVTLQAYAAVSLITLLVGFAGSSSVGFLMDRFKPIPVIVTMYLIDVVLIVLMGWLPFGSPGSILVFALFGYVKGAGQAGINAICAQVYPAKIRSTGVGWAFGMGRFGGVFAPIVGGALLASSLTLVQVFSVVAFITFILAALLVALGWVTARRKRLMEGEAQQAADLERARPA